MWEQVGKRINQLRKDQGLSRSQLGQLIGFSEQYIGKIERGETNISGEAIAKICNVIGTSADYILFGTTDLASVSTALTGLSQEQIDIGLDILKRLSRLINTENGNNALIQEVLRQQNA